MSQIVSRTASRTIVLPLGIALVDLAFQKGATDPLNPIKLWVLGLMAIWFFADLVTTRQSFQILKDERVFTVFGLILGIFGTGYFIAFILTPVKSVALFGDSGRNIGFLNYAFLGLVTLYCAYKLSLDNIKNIYWTIFFRSSIKKLTLKLNLLKKSDMTYVNLIKDKVA